LKEFEKIDKDIDEHNLTRFYSCDNHTSTMSSLLNLVPY
jgi:hypothetical protein